MVQIKIANALKNLNVDFPFKGEVTLAPSDVGEDILTLTPLVAEGVFTGVTADALHFEGTITGKLTATCGKCLDEMAYPIDVAFEEIFVRAGSAEENGEDADEDRFTFSGDLVELDEMVRTLVLLSLPIRFVCLEGCRQESMQELDAAAAKAAKEESPFAALLEIYGGGVADGTAEE